MKKYYIVFVIILTYNNVFADNFLLSSLKFAGGMITAYSVHEGGHYLVARLTNENIEFETNTSYNQPIGFRLKAKNRNNGLIINSAGITSQLILSESILRSDIDRSKKYVQGIMFWNVINPILYSLDYHIFKRNNFEKDGRWYGDLKGIEHFSDKNTANLFSIGSSLIAIYQGYRFLHEKNYKKNDVSLNFTPINNYNGFTLTISKSF